MLILDKQVSILMMKKDNNGRYLSSLNKQAKKILTEAFGGVTITSASGTWLNNKQLYEDSSYEFTCNYAKSLTMKQLKAFISVINLEFKKGGQLAVSVFVGSTLYIIEPGDLQALSHMLTPAEA